MLKVEVLINVAKKTPERLNDLPIIRVMRFNTEVWSLDNRRLYVFHSTFLEMEIYCNEVPHTQRNLEEYGIKRTSRDGSLPSMR